MSLLYYYLYCCIDNCIYNWYSILPNSSHTCYDNIDKWNNVQPHSKYELYASIPKCSGTRQPINFRIWINLQVITAELPIVLRENANGVYRTSAYFLAKNIAELPQYIILPILYNTIVYWMSGLYPNFWNYCFASLVTILITNVAISICKLCSVWPVRWQLLHSFLFSLRCRNDLCQHWCSHDNTSNLCSSNYGVWRILHNIWRHSILL